MISRCSHCNKKIHHVIARLLSISFHCSFNEMWLGMISMWKVCISRIFRYGEAPSPWPADTQDTFQCTADSDQYVRARILADTPIPQTITYHQPTPPSPLASFSTREALDFLAPRIPIQRQIQIKRQRQRHLFNPFPRAQALGF